jgi:exopolysaccharide biosynthesis polyprenyl glycosylphosphotransferase
MFRLDLTRLRWLHVLTDALLVSLGWIGAYWVRYALNEPLGKPINPFDDYVAALPMVVIPWIATCWWFGIYHSPRMRTTVDELQRLVRGIALGLLVLSSVGFFVKEADFGRTVVLASAVSNLFLQGASRLAFHHFERVMRRSGTQDVSVLIVGTGVAAIRLLQKLQDHPEIGYRVVGFLGQGDDLPEKVAGHPLLGRVEDVRDVAAAHGVKEIFVALPSLGHTRMLSLVLACEDLGITFRVVTNLFEVLTAGTHIDLVDDLPLVQLGRERVHALYEPAKRVFDVLGAGCALLLSGPLMLWAAWRLRRSGAAPLFVQNRVGRDGKTFRMYKFRTLRDDVDPYEVAPRGRHDPRITEYGRWLRVTSIDELPQLFNVLKGDMTLIGPRPPTLDEVEKYEPWQRRRLEVVGGLTCIWQVSGRSEIGFEDWVRMDIQYQERRSVLFDLKLLFKTVGAVISGRGAY